MLRVSYHETLDATRIDLSRLGAVALDAVHSGATAVLHRDTALAGRVIAGYDDIAEIRRRVEATCIELLWKQQPVAGELRIVAGMIEVAADFERVGYHGLEIAKHAIKLSAATERPSTDAISALAHLAQKMGDEVLQALKNDDVAAAHAATAHEDEVDALYARGIAALQSEILAKVELVHAGTSALFTLAAIQRACEREQNAGYNVLFMLGAA